MNKLLVNVLQLYQTYIHGDIYTLIKEPYESSLLDYINKSRQNSNWEQTLGSIQASIR